MEAQALYARQQEDLEELISAYLEQNNISEDSVQYIVSKIWKQMSVMSIMKRKM